MPLHPGQALRRLGARGPEGAPARRGPCHARRDRRARRSPDRRARTQSLDASRPVVQGMRLPIILSTLLIGAAGIGLAACGSSDNSAGASTATGLVSVDTVDGSHVLADSAGKTL